MGTALAVCDCGTDFTEADIFATVVTFDVMVVIDAYSTDATIRVTYFSTYVKLLVTAFVDTTMNEMFPFNGIVRLVDFDDFGVHDLEPVVDGFEQLGKLVFWVPAADMEVHISRGSRNRGQPRRGLKG